MAMKLKVSPNCVPAVLVACATKWYVESFSKSVNAQAIVLSEVKMKSESVASVRSEDGPHFKPTADGWTSPNSKRAKIVAELSVMSTALFVIAPTLVNTDSVSP